MAGGFHRSQCRECIGGFAALAYQQAQAAGRHRGLAVAEFAGDVGVDGDARDRFEPVTADQAGIIGGPARGDRDAADGARVEWQVGQRYQAAGWVHHAVQAVADYRGVFVQLFLHVVAEAGLADGGAGKRGAADFTGDFVALEIVQGGAFAAQHGPVAVVQIGDAGGEGCQG